MTTTPHQDGLPALPDALLGFGSISRSDARELLRAYALEALAAVGRPVQGEVHQFRKKHCSDWYDGHPDPSDGGGPYECRTLYTQPASPEQTLTVWFGSMPESNGRENWTVMLRRKLDFVTTDNIHDRHRLLGGMTLFRSEYKDRMRYHADELRFLLGEISERPDICAYDADLRSGYVEPASPERKPLTALQLSACLAEALEPGGAETDLTRYARAIERAHGIAATQGPRT